VILDWAGQGTIQRSTDLTGPWETLTNDVSPQTLTLDSAKRFFRIVAP